MDTSATKALIYNMMEPSVNMDSYDEDFLWCTDAFIHGGFLILCIVLTCGVLCYGITNEATFTFLPRSYSTFDRWVVLAKRVIALLTVTFVGVAKISDLAFVNIDKHDCDSWWFDFVDYVVCSFLFFLVACSLGEWMKKTGYTFGHLYAWSRQQIVVFTSTIARTTSNPSPHAGTPC